MDFYFNFDTNIMKKIKNKKEHPLKDEIICIQIDDDSEDNFKDVDIRDIFQFKTEVEAKRNFLKMKIDRIPDYAIEKIIRIF